MRVTTTRPRQSSRHSRDDSLFCGLSREINQATTLPFDRAALRLSVHLEFLSSPHSIWLQSSSLFECIPLPSAFASSALGAGEVWVRQVCLLGEKGIQPSCYKIWLPFHCMLDLMSAVFR